MKVGFTVLQKNGGNNGLGRPLQGGYITTILLARGVELHSRSAAIQRDTKFFKTGFILRLCHGSYLLVVM